MFPGYPEANTMHLLISQVIFPFISQLQSFSEQAKVGEGFLESFYISRLMYLSWGMHTSR